MSRRRPLHRSRFARLLTVVAFAAAALSFFLPFLAITEERHARATGLELVTKDAHFSGRYVHGSYIGEVELIVRRSRRPAIGALGLAILGFVAALVPGRRAEWTALALAVAGLLALGVLWRVTTMAFISADHRYGFALSAAFFAAALGLVAARLRSYYRQWAA